MVLQLWPSFDGHYPAAAYQAAFALNVVFQIAAGIWFALPWLLKSLPSHVVGKSSELHSNRSRLTKGSGCEFKMAANGVGSL
jgi:hypothetical protein